MVIYRSGSGKCTCLECSGMVSIYSGLVTHGGGDEVYIED